LKLAVTILECARIAPHLDRRVNRTAMTHRSDLHISEVPLRRLRFFSTILGLGCLLCGTAAAQATAPSVEIRRLAFYVGRWSEAGQMRGDSNKPFAPIAGGETCRWAAGGYAVLCEEKTTGAGGGWEGVYILSYDATAKQYHVYGTERPGSNMHAVGRVDGERWVWITDPAPDGSLLRYTFAPKGQGARTMTVETGRGQSWTSIVNITYTPQE
jgi:hypothetical protein